MSSIASDAARRRALLVVDVQNDYDGGGLAIRHPPFRDSLANILHAMDAAAIRRVRTVVVRHVAPPGSPIFAADGEGGALHPEIAARPRDRLVEKTLASAFAGTDLEQWLRAEAIDTLTIVGFMTHNCVLSTIIQAAHSGFSVEFLSDAGGSLPYANSAGHASAEEIHRVVSVVLQSGFAAVLGTREWIERLASGAPPERDNILISYRRALARETHRHSNGGTPR